MCKLCTDKFGGIDTGWSFGGIQRGGGTASKAISNSIRAAKKFDCEFCGKTFRESRLRDMHARIHNSQNKDIVKTKNIKCNICDVRFSKTSDYTAHYQMHANDKPKLSHSAPSSESTPSSKKARISTEGSNEKVGTNQGKEPLRLSSHAVTETDEAAGTDIPAIDIINDRPFRSPPVQHDDRAQEVEEGLHSVGTSTASSALASTRVLAEHT